MEQTPNIELFSLSFLPWFLASLACAVSLYAFFSYYQRTVLGALIRALDQAGAFSPESAKSLHELNLAKEKTARRALKKSAVRRAVVSVTNQNGEQVLYLSPEHLERTRAQFCRHVGTVLSPILVTLVSFLLAAAAYFILPQLIVFPA